MKQKDAKLLNLKVRDDLIAIREYSSELNDLIGKMDGNFYLEHSHIDPTTFKGIVNRYIKNNDLQYGDAWFYGFDNLKEDGTYITNATNILNPTKLYNIEMLNDVIKLLNKNKLNTQQHYQLNTIKKNAIHNSVIIEPIDSEQELISKELLFNTKIILPQTFTKLYEFDQKLAPQMISKAIRKSTFDKYNYNKLKIFATNKKELLINQQFIDEIKRYLTFV